MEILKKCPPYQNRYIIQKILKKTEYNILTYDDIFIDETSKVTKIKKGDYLEIGKYPIVDQGQEHIGGYTNEEESIYTNTPFIIFGDHTRTVKYIDFSSFIGADGVKVLNIKEDISEYLDMKYMYYYLIYTDIPNDGYSRHFKYIKKLLYVVPPIEIQKQIVEVLDEGQKLIDNRKKQIELLDDLIESIFYDMVGDPVKNDKGWEVKKLGEFYYVRTGKTPKRGLSKYWNNPEINWIKTGEILNGVINSSKEKISRIAKEELNMYLFSEGDILIAMYGQGNTRGRVAKLNIKSTTNQACAGLVKKEDSTINNEYTYNILLLLYEQLRDLGRGGNQPNLNLEMIREYEIPVPPLQLQNQFAEKVQAIEKQKELLQKSLKLMKDNYNGLMQRAFKGELF